ncbi:hypothetical protein BDN72DRAFT_523451 [Pluteus cervinus]|uniref:Uncharacterized protein n=1 Tax=Pluteus cervinus TaxID=181527 RepID=A0ACD3A4C4_9AGAR|nr:hypothetical protein BDN72DRAFT_523451 [Pluteus cervinus]
MKDSLSAYWTQSGSKTTEEVQDRFSRGKVMKKKARLITTSSSLPTYPHTTASIAAYAGHISASIFFVAVCMLYCWTRWTGRATATSGSFDTSHGDEKDKLVRSSSEMKNPEDYVLAVSV